MIKTTPLRPLMTSFRRTIRTDCAVSAWRPHLQPTKKKSSCSLIVNAGVGVEGGGNWPLDWQPTKPLPIARIQNKATFSFSTHLASSLAFET